MTREEYINIIEIDKAELTRENQELKKQVEDMTLCRDIASGHREEVQDRENILLNQQKEFIKYLEDEIKKEKDDLENLCELYKIPKENRAAYKFAYSYINKMAKILQKYKEIIGISDENNIS